MLHSTSLVLFESTDATRVLSDPVNEDWLAVVGGVCGELYEVIARRYYLALSHFRAQRRRSPLPGGKEVSGSGRQEALEAVLSEMEERKRSDKVVSSRHAPAVFVEARPDPQDETLPEALRDFSKAPPSLGDLLSGPGRPPCDSLSLMRAFLAAPLLGVGDSPKDVYRLLRTNPTFARACGFLGREAMKQLGELSSRRLPGLSTCEEFSEVMTRYGLWQLARIEQVVENLTSGVVELEDTLAFDTTHLEANSHCASVVVHDATSEDKKTTQRKVPRVRKTCECGRANWETCGHPWVPTDQGAAVVVKGPTRIYWAHKASIASLGNSEVPIDARSLQHAADHDSRTLLPHLKLLRRDLPLVLSVLLFILADDGYQGQKEAVARFHDKARLILPVHPNGRSKEKLAQEFSGIDRFTPTGVPVCDEGHRFVMRGRDLTNERYIWTAPDDDAGQSVCVGCPLATSCLTKGTRRHIRVDRSQFPPIDWDQPQHLAREKARYQRRTGVERAIKRIKVDLNGEHLTHRDGPRVQAHLDRKLLIIHLLLKADSG